MEKQIEEQGKSVDVFQQISGVLEVPTINKPLPDNRKWNLPLPDSKALADYQGAPEVIVDQTQTQSETSKTGKSYAKDSPISSGRS